MFDVTKTTLFKWEKEGKLKKIDKDWRGWRVFSDDNVNEIRKIIIEKKRHDFDVRAMAKSVAESLWAIYHCRADAPLLILPKKRNRAIRVSEQESKILLSHWLEREGVPYSVETPTVDTYQQKGQSPLSARIDVTVYRQPEARRRPDFECGTQEGYAARRIVSKGLRETAPRTNRRVVVPYA